MRSRSMVTVAMRFVLPWELQSVNRSLARASRLDLGPPGERGARHVDSAANVEGLPPALRAARLRRGDGVRGRRDARLGLSRDPAAGGEAERALGRARGGARQRARFARGPGCGLRGACGLRTRVLRRRRRDRVSRPGRRGDHALLRRGREPVRAAGCPAGADDRGAARPLPRRRPRARARLRLPGRRGADAARLPEVGLGIIASSGGTHRLVRLVGPARAKELLLLRDRFTAAEARELGLVTEVVPEGGALARALELAERLAGLPARPCG